jgi:hypothetical protein
MAAETEAEHRILDGGPWHGAGHISRTSVACKTYVIRREHSSLAAGKTCKATRPGSAQLCGLDRFATAPAAWLAVIQKSGESEPCPIYAAVSFR